MSLQGMDYRSKHPTESNIGKFWIEPPKRERKANYQVRRVFWIRFTL